MLTSKSVKTTNLNDSPAEYDRYVYATSWAGSKCVFNNCTHFGKKDVFNIHGLWPGTSKNPPFFCKEMYFEESNYDEYVKKNIYLYWNSMYNPNWGFIHHELSKHGTCWRPDYGDSSMSR